MEQNGDDNSCTGMTVLANYNDTRYPIVFIAYWYRKCIIWPPICLSICLLRSSIVSKQLNVLSYFLQPSHFGFPNTKHLYKILTRSPLRMCWIQVGSKFYDFMSNWPHSSRHSCKHGCCKCFLPVKIIPHEQLCRHEICAFGSGCHHVSHMLLHRWKNPLQKCTVVTLGVMLTCSLVATAKFLAMSWMWCV